MRDMGEAQAMHDAIQAFLTAISHGTGPGGFDPMIARRDLLASPEVQRLANAADLWEASR
jgi:hypothetical protein